MQRNVKILHDIIEQVEDNISEEINIVDLARSCDVSPWHFQRVFKTLVRDTLGGYIRGRRLTKAAHLLRDSNQSIIDIALMSGFQSHEAFTRSFSAYFNVSPKNYRKYRPPVFLKEKPLLTSNLFHHMASELNQDPEIQLRKPQTLIGFSTTVPSPFVSQEGHCDLLFPCWEKLFSRQNEIPNRLPCTHYGMSISQSGNFTEETVEYLAGVPVSEFTQVPQGMASYTLPEQLVAVFEVSVVEKDTVFNTIDYIYGYWLPNSQFLRGVGGDYEYFENIEDGSTSGSYASKYVVPIVEK